MICAFSYDIAASHCTKTSNKYFDDEGNPIALGSFDAVSAETGVLKSQSFSIRKKDLIQKLKSEINDLQEVISDHEAMIERLQKQYEAQTEAFREYVQRSQQNVSGLNLAQENQKLKEELKISDKIITDLRACVGISSPAKVAISSQTATVILRRPDVQACIERFGGHQGQLTRTFAQKDRSKSLKRKAAQIE